MFEGTFTNGTVVFTDPPPIAEGETVEVVVKKKAEQEQEPTMLGLMKFAGIFKDGPSDWAEEHDHYIHGTPRRKPLEGQ